MLFEIMMARYDILNEYRTSVKNIINQFMSRPQGVLKLIPKLIGHKADLFDLLFLLITVKLSNFFLFISL